MVPPVRRVPMSPGIVLAEVRRDRWRSNLRVVDTITQPEATARTLTSYVVEPGRAGAQPA